LDVHNREKHGIIKIGNTTLDKASLKQSLNTETSDQIENSLQCKVCREEFISQELLDDHEKKEHEKSAEKKPSQSLAKVGSSNKRGRKRSKIKSSNTGEKPPE
jgi:hypothetical protein